MANNTNYINNLFGRNFGGTGSPEAVADPYISGYGYVWFNVLPSILQGMFPKSQSTLASLAFVITPPAITLNKTTIEGVGGTQWSAPTRLNIGNEYSIEYVELAGTPVSNIINNWIVLARDFRTGLSDLPGASNTTGLYTKSNYAGSMYYWTVDPDGITIETAWYYTGVFPTSFVSSEFHTDVATNGELRLTINFSVDNIYRYDSTTGALAGNTSLATYIQNQMTSILSYKNTLLTMPTSSS